MKSLIISNNNYHYILINRDNFEVILCDLGASIYSIKNGNDYLTLTPNKECFENLTYYNGKIIGRSANRHKGNIFVIGGKKYIVENNENENTLHGGLHGLSTKVFAFEIKEENDKVIVTFTYTSKDGESGFPGNLNLEITYVISFASCEVLCQMSAIADALTVCALTNHTAFSLGERNINNLKLQVYGSNYLLTNSDNLLPIKIDSVPSYLDFRKLKKVIDDIDNPSLKEGKLNGYDHFLYFDDMSSKPQVILESTKYRLEISSDFEGVQVYSDSIKNDYQFYNAIGNCRRGVALELQDSFLSHTTLASNEVYKHYIRYRFQKI